MSTAEPVMVFVAEEDDEADGVGVGVDEAAEPLLDVPDDPVPDPLVVDPVPDAVEWTEEDAVVTSSPSP
ncbi:hypothetical protein GCM10009820_10820 [Leifsonia soli]